MVYDEHPKTLKLLRSLGSPVGASSPAVESNHFSMLILSSLAR
jgi:hypothetical protein